MDRHLNLMRAGSVVLFNADKIAPGEPRKASSCARSRSKTGASAKGDLVQNTIALAAV